MTLQEEVALIERAKGGDTGAYGTLVRENHLAVRRYLSHFLGDAATADDLAQDVFVLGFRDLNGFEPRGRLLGWLLGIARHRAQMHVRTEHRRHLSAGRRALEAVLEGADHDVVPGQHERELAALEDCLANLQPGAANLIREHYFAGTSLVQIAHQQGKSAVALRVALLRARGWLRACIHKKLAIEHMPGGRSA